MTSTFTNRRLNSRNSAPAFRSARTAAAPCTRSACWTRCASSPAIPRARRSACGTPAGPGNYSISAPRRSSATDFPMSRSSAPTFCRCWSMRSVRAKRPEAIHLGRRAVGMTQSGGKVLLRFEDGKTATGDALIGADGVHSVIRRELFGGDNARFLGMIAWRGVIPIGRVPPHISRDMATNWIGVGGHVVHYPLRAGKLMNFVGIQERADWQVESWTMQGTAQECANDHAGWHDDVQALIAASPRLFKWALLGRDPLPQWTVDNVTLLGDACHPTLPMLAQGAVMAIEDAVILGRCFDKYGDVATALSRYQDARIAVTTRKVAGANDNAKRFHNPALGTEQGAAAYVRREWSRDAIIRRYEWIFTYNVDAVEV